MGEQKGQDPPGSNLCHPFSTPSCALFALQKHKGGVGDQSLGKLHFKATALRVCLKAGGEVWLSKNPSPSLMSGILCRSCPKTAFLDFESSAVSPRGKSGVRVSGSKLANGFA